MCVAMVITLLVWFRNRFNEQGPLARSMSGAAYATYVFHPAVIVWLAVALRGIRLDMALKYLLVVPFAVGLAFLAGYLVFGSNNPVTPVVHRHTGGGGCPFDLAPADQHIVADMRCPSEDHDTALLECHCDAAHTVKTIVKQMPDEIKDGQDFKKD